MHEIIVSPTKHGKFTAHYKGVLLCTSETPFFDGARELVRRNWASPDDILTMRHEGSLVWAMRATVSRAAACSISQPSAGGAPKLRKYEPFTGPDTSAGHSSEAA